MTYYHICIFGMVQCVGFRYFAYRKANEIGNINGFVKNQYDGSLFIEVEAEKEKLNQFITHLKQGPSRSNIESILIEEFPFEGKYNHFTIK
jgi:acylphosphatase